MKIIAAIFGLLFLLLGLAFENNKIESLSMQVARLKEERNKDEMEVAYLRQKIAELSTLSHLEKVAMNRGYFANGLSLKGGHGIDLASSLDTSLISGSRSPSFNKTFLFANSKKRREVERTR